MSKGFCYWCGEELQTKAFRRYVGVDSRGKNVHEYFCDEVCQECFENDSRIENEENGYDTIKEVKIQKNGYKSKRCTTCGRGGKAQEFPCKVIVDADRGNNSGKKYYFCNKGCLKTFIKKVDREEEEI